MYSSHNLVHILTMLECIEKCWIYIAEFDNPHDFTQANDQKELNAVIGLFIAIGEESKKIDGNLKNALTNGIIWSEVAGMRDKMSHNYRGIDEEVLWAVLQNDLLKLKNSLIEMFRLVDAEPEMINEFLQSPYYKHLSYLKI